MDSIGRAPRSARATVRILTDAVRRQFSWPRSYRLTFSFDEAGLRLVRRTPRLQPAPPSDNVARAPLPNAILAELRSSRGVVLYRKRLRDPIPQDVEVFDAQGMPHRVRAVRSRGMFSVIVPNLRGANTVAIDAGPDVILAQTPFASRARQLRRWLLLQTPMRGADRGNR
jgi:hypothetical protein